MNISRTMLNKILVIAVITNMVCTTPLLALQEQGSTSIKPSIQASLKKEPRRTWKKFIGLGLATVLTECYSQIAMSSLSAMDEGQRGGMAAKLTILSLLITWPLSIKMACKFWRNFPDKEARRAAYHLLGAIDHGVSMGMSLLASMGIVAFAFSAINRQHNNPVIDGVIPSVIGMCILPLLLHVSTESWKKTKEEWSKYQSSEDALPTVPLEKQDHAQPIPVVPQ